MNIDFRNGVYEFTYLSDEIHLGVSDVRAHICRFVDGAMQSLLRDTNKMEIHIPAEKRQQLITMQCGDIDEESESQTTA